MRTIQFQENQKEDWNKFITENNSESFLQAWEWGSFQENVGRKILRVGIVEDNLLATALIIKYDLPFRQSYLYCPKGPVINRLQVESQKLKVSDFLFKEVKKIAKKEKALFLKIDPPTEQTLKNEEYFNHFQKSPNEIQPKNTLLLNLTKSKEDLLKEMKSKTRYNIRLAEKKGIRIIDIKYQISSIKYFEKYFGKFWELMSETSKRDKFNLHNKNYYWKILESLNNGTDDNLTPFNNLTAKLYLAEYEDKIIAANIVLFFGNLCVYLHGASSSKYRNVMAPYLLQWQQILDAQKTGYQIYDFWGISLSDTKKNNWQGITRFKKGFNGFEKKYSGAYDLAFNQAGYLAYQLMKKIRNISAQ